jgi:hypothetical protein
MSLEISGRITRTLPSAIKKWQAPGCQLPNEALALLGLPGWASGFPIIFGEIFVSMQNSCMRSVFADRRAISCLDGI